MRILLNLKESPQSLLLLTAIAFLLALSLSPITNIKYHDMSMFGVPLATMAWIIPLLLISLWLLYIFIGRFLYSKTITWIHILITEIATILILIVLYIGIHPTEFTNDRHELIGLAMQILSILFVLGQLAFFVNALLGFFTIQKAQGLKS